MDGEHKEKRHYQHCLQDWETKKTYNWKAKVGRGWGKLIFSLRYQWEVKSQVSLLSEKQESSLV